MNSKKKTGIKTGEISQLAKKIVDENIRRTTDNMGALSPEVARRMLNELQVHQLELEMQNEELRQAQNDLEASRSLYYNFYNLAPVGYLTISETGLIVEANLTMAAMLGISINQLIGQPLTRFIYPEDQNQYYLHNKLLFATGASKPCELRLVNKSTVQFWIRMEATLVFGAEDTAHCNAVVIDITERKLAEEALTAERNILVTLINAIPDRIFIKDKESRFTLSNIAHIKSLGANSQSEVIGKTIQNYRSPMLTERYLADDLKVMENNQPLYDYEEPTILPSGETGTLLISKVPFHDSTGEVIGIIGISRDISVRKQAEEKLRKSEEKFCAILKSTVDGFWMVGTNGRIVEVNETFCSMLGYTQDELLDMHINDIDATESSKEIDERIARIHLNGSEIFETRHRRKDGSIFDVEISATLLPNSNGQMIGFCRDITNRRRVEEKLRKSDKKTFRDYS